MIGSNLTEKARVKMCNLLQQSLDVFSWTPADMTGILRHITEHRLNVREGCQPIRQKKRGQAAERNTSINDEVSKLVAAGIMRGVHYHDWLSNLVMVKKNDNSWIMCVDFKDLNKACPKDRYPLPEIDWKVESQCRFPFKCFMDAYKGLRNVVATYQRLVDKTFHGQIGRNLEVYVEDLVIKSRTKDEVVCDIEETFRTLRKINMKLNPKKCTFGVEEGMFLGYQVNTKGIKICPDKVDAVLSLQSPKCLKDVQKLNGKLASLNRFLAKSAEKLLPFFKTLKKCTKKSDFIWTEEAESAYRQMKELIAKWSIQLGEFGIHYRPRISVKRQVLADFIMERPEEEDPDDSIKEGEPLPAQWTLFTDGSSCVDGCRAGVVNVDLKLVASQVNGTYVAKETHMIKYLEKVKTLASAFREFSIKQVPRNGNKKADALSKMASTS
ncbi:reverse transcriptase domain-containing protein, partial [Tanacetum coccineum]